MWKQKVCKLRRFWEVQNFIQKLTLNISLLPRPRLVKLSFGMYLQMRVQLSNFEFVH